MSQFVFLWMFFLSMVLGNVEVKPYDKVKELFNYGVILENKGTLFTSANHWEHFFEIELQTFPFVNENPSTCFNCQWYNEAVGEILTIHKQTTLDVGSIVSEIKSLLPHHSTVRIPISRKRRSFLPFIGSLAKTLFGTATSADLTNLARNVAMIRANQQKMAKAASHQLDIFTAAIRNFDSRIENAFQVITDNHDAIKKLGKDFNVSIVSAQVAQAKLLVALSTQTRLTIRILSRFEELLMGVLSTIQEKLSPLLIPHQTMSNVLTYIQDQIQPHGFYLIHSHPAFYYKNAKFTIFRRFSKIMIMVQFPMTSLSFKLYKIMSFPVPLNEITHHGTQLATSNDYLILSDNNKLFAEVSFKDLQSCVYGNHEWHCDKHIVLSNNTKRSCLFNLFHAHKNLINSNCLFHLVPKLIKPSLIKLNSSHLVMINDSKITAVCEGKTTVQAGCLFCIIPIPCRCSLVSKSLYLPPQWNGCRQNNTNQLSKVHAVNLILLQQFFNGSLKDIHPNSAFSKMLDIKLPHYQIFTQNFSKMIATEQKQRFDLKKTAQAAKQNQMVYQSLSESMLDYQSNLQNSEIDFTTILSIISLGIAVVSLLAFMFLFRKYRLLITTVTILSKTQKSQTIALPVFHYTTPSTTTTTDSPVDISTHMYTTSEILGTLFVICLICYFIYKYCKRDSFKLVLELTNNYDTVLVPICNLPYAHDCLIFTTVEPFSDFKVSYGFRSSLYVNWASFTVKDLRFSTTFTLPSRVYLHPLMAYRTSRIINTTFTALCYKRLGNVLYPVEIQPVNSEAADKLYLTLEK